MKALDIPKILEWIATDGGCEIEQIRRVRLRGFIPHRQILCHVLRYYGVAYRDIAEILEPQFGGSISRITIAQYASAELNEEQRATAEKIKNYFGLPTKEQKRQDNDRLIENHKETNEQIAKALAVTGLDFKSLGRFIGLHEGSLLSYMAGTRKTPRRVALMLDWIAKYEIKPDSTK